MFDLGVIPPDRWKMAVFSEWRPPHLEWRNIPFHEAGHAVLMRHFGLKPAIARVSECRRSSGYVSLGRDFGPPDQMDLEAKAAECFPLHDFMAINANLHESEAALQAAIILVAGIQSELMRAQLVPDGLVLMSCSDTRRARESLSSAFSTDRPLFWCQAQARHLLRRNWDEVNSIAMNLQCNGVVAFD